MKYNPNFNFSTCVSIDNYTSKTEAGACLSKKGAAAVGKQKMAFVEQSLSIPQFISLATTGHTFCNLFSYDPNKKYTIETKNGKHYRQYPVYQDGPNKGGMKLTFKSDTFFRGTQTIFVDIDYTQFTDIVDYLHRLTLHPTIVYMSFSDKKDKGGVVSRRFRMVYVFDSVLNKDQMMCISKAIHDRIVMDTGEPMDDDCGTRPSQYFNGVYGNDEVYASYEIYSLMDFMQELTIWQPPIQAPQKLQITFDKKLVYDMSHLSYTDFTHRYSIKHPYRYRTEKQEWKELLYQETDDNYLQLWFYKEKLVDGQHRRRSLFKNACLRRLMFPDMTPDTMLYNLYIDLCRFFDNSDHVFTPELLMRKVKNAFQKTSEELEFYCSAEIKYWRDNRPRFIVHPGYKMSFGLANYIKERIRYDEIDRLYDRGKSLRENLAGQCSDIPQTTLYRYCHDRNIDTAPGKQPSKRQQRREEKQKMIEQFQTIYDISLTVRENQARMKRIGLDLSIGTIENWLKKYPVLPKPIAPEINIIPKFTPITFNNEYYNNDPMLRDCMSCGWY